MPLSSVSNKTLLGTSTFFSFAGLETLIGAPRKLVVNTITQPRRMNPFPQMPSLCPPPSSVYSSISTHLHEPLTWIPLLDTFFFLPGSMCTIDLCGAHWYQSSLNQNACIDLPLFLKDRYRFDSWFRHRGVLSRKEQKTILQAPMQKGTGSIE